MIRRTGRTSPGRLFLCGLLLVLLAGCATGGADLRLLDDAGIAPPGEASVEMTTVSLKDIQLRRIAEKIGVVLHFHF
jgi:hypothetical protein